MTTYAADNSSIPLLAVVQMLLSARGLDDVRAATAHGAELITRYSTLSLYEVQADGALELTTRSGDELGPGAEALEELLRERARGTGKSVSTLDMPLSQRERLAVRDYSQRNALCIARPLYAHSKPIGIVVLHYADRAALEQTEFDMLRRFVEFAADALLTARTSADLQTFAYSDPLTGLANRRWLDIEFERLQGSEVSLILIDFDGLKTVNDTLDFDRGDELIRAIGVVLAASAQPAEFVVRYGGDEFVVVMPETGRERALRRAEELTTILDGMTLPPDIAALFHGASVGAATAQAGDDLRKVLLRASAEMRSRKRRRKTDRGLTGNDGGHQSAGPVPEAGAQYPPRWDLES
jgi:diguanylate cyclase (GGDEF)-like protein